MHDKPTALPPKKSHKRPFNIRIFLQQLINFIIWVIVVLLTLRILLLVLGANPAAPFADFILQASHYVAWPFLGLFNSKPIGETATSYFDTSSLVGIVVYLLIGLGLNKLLSVTKT